MKIKLIPITNIKKVIYTGKVYDLEVEKDHSYNVHNIIVHNSVCKTRNNTGCGVPQLYALEQIRRSLTDYNLTPRLISDGGINTVGDIAKALKYADLVMVGGFLAGTSETPGNVYKGPDGQYYKMYGGSASGENKGQNTFVEGMTKTVLFRGKVKYILREIKDGLQSAFSYVGAKNMVEYKEKCEFIHISGGSSRESKF